MGEVNVLGEEDYGVVVGGGCFGEDSVDGGVVVVGVVFVDGVGGVGFDVDYLGGREWGVLW